MQINKIDGTKFNGIYRIQNTPKNVHEIEKFVEPMYKHLKNEPVLQFVGEHPFRVGLDIIMEVIAKTQNASVSWLKMNAESHGAMLANIENDSIHIVSGKKELENLLDYLISRVEKRTGFLGRIKAMFYRKGNYDDKPEHLRLLFEAFDFDEKEAAAFNKIYKDKIVSVSSPQELLQKMLCERS